MKKTDIRWLQRFENYQKALRQLSEFVSQGKLNKLEEQGLIQVFEYTHELAWKTLKDFLTYKGHGEIYGSKDVSRKAYGLNLIDDGEVWMQMIESRNQTVHTYNEDTAREIVDAINQRYYSQFTNLEKKLLELRDKTKRTE